MKLRHITTGIFLVVALFVTLNSAFAISSSFLFDDELGRAVYGDRLYPVVDSFVKVNLENANGFPLDDVTVSVWIPDLMVYTRTSSFTIYPDNTYGKVLFMELGSHVRPGTYLTRVLLSNEFDHKVSWQYLDIY